MSLFPEDRFFSGDIEDPLTLIFVALAAFIGQLAYLLLGIYHVNFIVTRPGVQQCQARGLVFSP